LIVEDEPLSRLYLSNLLAEAFPEITIVGTATNELAAIAAIRELQPELLFIDIELQQGSGFGIVQQIADIDDYIVFTTALDLHATSLLRLSGVSYIQKPIDLECLMAAVNGRKDKAHNDLALQHLCASLKHNGIPQSILLAHSNYPEYMALKDIIAIEGLGKCCRIWPIAGQPIDAAYELKDLEDLLKAFGFFRPHMQYIINRLHVLGVNEDGTLLRLKGGMELPVSQKKLPELVRFLER
jgi:two-component system LytT family response regulator